MRFYSLAVRNLKEIYRDPVSILLGLIMPLALLILFSSIQKNIGLDIFSPQSLTPGIIVFSFTFLMMFSSILLAKDKQSAFLVRLFTTPLRPSDYILSYILPFLPLAFFQALICIIAGIILGATFSNIFIALLLFLLIALMCISLGVIIGSLFSVNQALGIGSFLITAIGLFSGVWMDLKMAGGIFETIGYALPFAHAVDASKGLLSGSSFGDISGSFYVVVIYTVILFLLAILSFRWTMKKIVKKVFIVIGILLFAIIIVCVGIYNKFSFDKPLLKETIKAGFVEKQVTLEDGTVLNYAEGSPNGLPLFLIHGQMATWQIYKKVLPQLSAYYHIYAIDCHGHGKSGKNPEKYRAQAMGEDFVWFIENVIGEPAVVSGHSSGGLLAAWLAANSPENVLGVVLEDPPFFSSEAGRCEKTFAWIDSFVPCHTFLEQDETDDFTLYYIENCYWINFFGEGKEGIIKSAVSYRKEHPDERLEISYLPPSINNSFYYMETYDPRFGDAFYDCSWMENFNHAETLSKINCPSVLIHASWQYDDKGVLLAAMSGDDAERAHSLIENNVLIDVVSGHCVNDEKPEVFVKIMIDFLDEIK